VESSTSDPLRTQEFPKSKRGYDVGAVDEYMASIAETLHRLEQRIAALETGSPRPAAASGGMDAAAARALIDQAHARVETVEQQVRTMADGALNELDALKSELAEGRDRLEETADPAAETLAAPAPPPPPEVAKPPAPDPVVEVVAEAAGVESTPEPAVVAVAAAELGALVEELVKAEQVVGAVEGPMPDPVVADDVDAPQVVAVDRDDLGNEAGTPPPSEPAPYDEERHRQLLSALKSLTFD